MDDDFKIKAWPIVFHESNSRKSTTDILWPFIHHERQGTKSEFRIRPLIFFYSRDEKDFTLMIFFYIFYMSLQNLTRNIVIWPLLTWIKSRTSNHRTGSSFRAFFFGALLYINLKRENTDIHKYFKKIIFPLLLIWSTEDTRAANRYIFQTFLLLFWKYRSGPTQAFTLIVPSYFFYRGEQYTIQQFWPFFGTQKRKNQYNEWSTIYPFFRFRSDLDTVVPKKKTLHILWPIFKTEWSQDKLSVRLLPIIWARRVGNSSRGFVVIFFWSWIKDTKLIWGVFPFIWTHKYYDAQKTVSRNRGYVGLVYWDWKKEHYTIGGVMPFVHVKRRHKVTKEQGHHIHVLLMFLYIHEEYNELCFVTPFYCRFWGDEVQFQTLFYLFYYKAAKRFIPNQGNTPDVWDRWSLLVPLMTFIQHQPTKFTGITVFPLLFYYRRSPTPGSYDDKEYTFLMCPVYIFYTSIDRYYKRCMKFHSLLYSLLIVMTHESTEPSDNYKKVDVWLLAPLTRCKYMRDTHDKDVQFFIIPMFYLKGSIPTTSVTAKDVSLLVVVIPLLGYIQRDPKQLSVMLFLYLFGCSVRKVDINNATVVGMARVWLLPIFYYSTERNANESTRRHLFMFLPLIIFYRKLPDSHYTFVGGIYGEVRKRTFVLRYYPLLLAVRYLHIKYQAPNTLVQQKEEYDNNNLIILYGLIGRVQDPYDTITWVFICYFSKKRTPSATQNAIYSNDWAFFSLFGLPPYYVQYSDSFKMLWPFYLWYENNASTLFILPPLIRVQLDLIGKTKWSFFPFIDFKYNSIRQTFRLRFFYIFNAALFCIKLKRTCDYHKTHIRTFKFVLFPWIYYEKKHLMTRDLVATDEQPLINNATYKSSSVPTLSLPPNMKHQNMIVDKYTSARPETILTILYFWKGYGLFNLKDDQQLHKWQMYLVPFFHFEMDKTVLLTDTHNTESYYTANVRRRDYVALSFIWLLHPNICLANYHAEQNGSFQQSQTMYIAILIHISASNNASARLTNIDNNRSVALFWFLSPNLSFIYHEIYAITDTRYGKTFYVFPFYWYDTEKTMKSENREKEEQRIVNIDENTCVSIFWFIHRRISLFSWNRHQSKQDDKLLLQTTWWYWYPFFYHTDGPNHNNFKMLFIPTYDRYPIAFYSHMDTYSTPYQEYIPRKERSLAKRVVYMVPFFYTEELFKNNKKQETNIWILWFFYKKVALCSRWSHVYGAAIDRGFYILLMVMWRLQKDNTTPAIARDKSVLFSLLWIHPYLAVFHYSTEKRGGHLLSRPQTDIELVNVGDVKIDVSPQDTPSPSGVMVYTETDVLFYILVIIYIRKKDNPFSFKISLLWFFVRQAAFIRLTKTMESIKYGVFPFFKYMRHKGVRTQWCLFPFVPIKYSFTANFLVYEKYVHKRGATTDGGVEDKKARVQDRYVRILYRVARFSSENDTTNIEINPWWSYERNEKPGSEFRIWDCCGGICGKKRKGGRDQTRVCCFWYC